FLIVIYYIFFLFLFLYFVFFCYFFFFFQAEDGIRDYKVTGVQTCALPILIGYPERKAGPEHHPRVLWSARPLALNSKARLRRDRSEERRVGKECRGRGGQDH